MDFVRRGLSLVASASKHRVSAGAALGVTPVHPRYVSNIVFNPAYSNKHIASLVCLHSLSDNPGARKKARRVGRGPGSSKGKTCGRGHKGQKSRSGATGHHDRTFEGGQTPLYKRMRKYGFTNPSKVDYDWINLDKLQYLIDKGRVDPSKPITMKSLFDARHFTKVPQGLKLLAGKHPEVFTAKVHLEVTAASEGAARHIEELGGTVKRVFYSPEALRALLKPEKFPLYKPHRGLPHPKKAHRFDDWGQDAAASDSTSPATASP